jgi:hypothetical protein
MSRPGHASMSQRRDISIVPHETIYDETLLWVVIHQLILCTSIQIFLVPETVCSVERM